MSLRRKNIAFLEKDRLENITRSFNGLRIGGGRPTDLSGRCLFGGKTSLFWKKTA